MLFRPLLPDPVAVAEGDPAGVEPEAWPEAVEPVARAVRHRQQEYVCARVLARELLASHGHPGHWVRAHADRSPTWPEGVVGAITHTSRRDAPGRVAVAVTRDPGIRGLGLDVEPDLPLPDEIGRAHV